MLAFYSILVEEAEEESDGFNIDLIFIDDFYTPAQKALFRQAADRWEDIIVDDIPDNTSFVSNPSTHTYLGTQVTIDLPIDDLLIYVGSGILAFEYAAEAEIGWVRKPSNLPLVAIINFDQFYLIFGSDAALKATMMHEIGHALGFGTVWEAFDFSQGLDGPDPYFSGPLAIAAYDLAGGFSRPRNKVPTENDPIYGIGGHWREAVFDNELMTPIDEVDETPLLSEVTIQSLADLGYVVAPLQADYYRLPARVSAKPTTGAKKPWCKVLPPEYAVDEHGQVWKLR